MARKQTNDSHRARQLVAQEAARIIVNHGVRDYRVAKQKAAASLGVSSRGALPGNTEVETAIAEHLQIFGGASLKDHLRLLRVAAISAMGMLASFTPRLVGSALSGTADENSAVSLHLFADNSESVALAIDALGIRFRACERRMKSRRDRVETYAGFSFRHSHTQIEATVFPIDGVRQAPISPIDGKPMRRANYEAVQRLLEQSP